MFKAHLRSPATLIMAGITFLSLLTLMHVIQGMTADAIQSQLLCVDILFMA
jgi:hypothetical protein